MKLKLLSLIVISSLSMNVYADSSNTKTDNANGSVGQTIRIKTSHQFTVKNDSNNFKNYTALETCKVNGHEYKKGWGFSLPPRGTKVFSEYAYLDYAATEKGSWKIDSSTCVANSSD